jgi:hypothetical protein
VRESNPPPPPKPRGRTGPTTKAGKAKTSRNATRHGIFSPHPVIIEGLETIEAWEQFEREIVESWDIEGRYEQELAERIAFIQWRLRRCRHHETAVLNHQVQSEEENLGIAAAYRARTLSKGEIPDVDPKRVFAFQQLRIIPSDLSIDRMLQYETTIHRMLVSTVHQLEAHQARRRGQNVALGRVEFNSVPSLGPQRSATASLAAVLGDGK